MDRSWKRELAAGNPISRLEVLGSADWTFRAHRLGQRRGKEGRRQNGSKKRARAGQGGKETECGRVLDWKNWALRPAEDAIAETQAVPGAPPIRSP